MKVGITRTVEGRGQALRPLNLKRVAHPSMRRPCIVPVSHKPDDKGYVRVVPRDGTGGRARPLHRLAWQSKYGPIPEGYEIDHICKVRSCCNRQHLRMLTVSDHKRITAACRYDDLHEEARCYWEATGRTATGADLAKRFGTHPNTPYGWLKRWKAEDQITVEAE